MCGADAVWRLFGFRVAGSPPRVRSRPGEPSGGIPAVGITSACAEQTIGAECDAVVSGDHLRVCGADLIVLTVLVGWVGSPPRVRSRLEADAGGPLRLGITSACAEQTSLSPSWSLLAQDHLRVCGADRLELALHGDDQGSPPRVRSRRPNRSNQRHRHGITSACAEQTHGCGT